MTENSRMVLDYLKNAGVGTKLTTKMVQNDLGLATAGAVAGSVQGLVKKGMAERFVETETVVGEDGVAKEKEVKYFALTEAGMNYNPDAENE